MNKFLFFAGVGLLIWSAPLSLQANAQNGSSWGNPIRECWVYSGNETSNLQIASDNDSTIFVPFANDRISAIDVDSGKTLWTKALESTLLSGLSAENSALFFTRSSDTPNSASNGTLQTGKSVTLSSVDVESGLDNWQRTLSTKGESEPSVFLVLAENYIVSAQTTGKIHALEKSSGRILWEMDLNTSLTGPPVAGSDYLVLPTQNRTAVQLTLSNGHLKSQIPIGFLPARLSLAGVHLVVGDENGSVTMLGFPDGKTVWKSRSGGAIREIKSVGNDILATSNDNYTYLFSGKNGDKLWKRRLSGRILGSALFDSTIAAFLSNGSTEALFLSLIDGKIVNRISPPGADYFVSGPVAVGDRVVFPTNNGLVAYGPNCSEQPKS